MRLKKNIYLNRKSCLSSKLIFHFRKKSVVALMKDAVSLRGDVKQQRKEELSLLIFSIYSLHFQRGGILRV